MKLLIHFALALVMMVGFAQGAPSAYTDVIPFNANNGAWSPQAMNPIYMALDCEGIEEYMGRWPIPLNSIDVDTGREIIGWDVDCEGTVVASGGTGTGNPEDQRDIPRAFGKITVKYAPQPPPPK